MKRSPPVPLPVAPDVVAGAAFYSANGLAKYDWFVLGLSNRFIWKCPTACLLAQYNQYVTSNHLEVGVGSGYFLDKCRFPTAQPKLILADLNTDCLAYTKRRLQRYAPETVIANVLDPLPAAIEPVDSIGLTYVLHCLPGPLQRKRAALANLRQRLRPNGVIFGATAIGSGVARSPLTSALMWHYNRQGIIATSSDSLSGLQDMLRDEFPTVSMSVVGTVLLFSARI
jgi:SAM-dependent methyltransferase